MLFFLVFLGATPALRYKAFGNQTFFLAVAGASCSRSATTRKKRLATGMRFSLRSGLGILR